MSSGDMLLLLRADAGIPPVTLGARLTWIVGTSTPVEQFPAIAFLDSATEYMDFHNLKLPPHYGGGGLTLIFGTGAAATSGGYVLEGAIRAIPDDTEDTDTTAHTYDYNTLTISTPPSAVGERTYDNMTFTSGADMDSLAVNQDFTLRVRRKHDNASDTLAGLVYLYTIEIRET